MRLLAIKLGLTLGVCGLIWWSLSAPDRGLVAEFSALGPIAGTAVAVMFLCAVAMYCRDLQRVLAAVTPQRRAAPPASVWLMFLIPYNLVEDFFIVANVAASLRAEAAANPALARRWGRCGLISGLGWCALQILSLMPLAIASVAGFLAVPLWLWHWRFARRAWADLLAATAT